MRSLFLGGGVVLSGLLLSFSDTTNTTTTVTPMRLAGSDLTISVQNEADHAITQARHWLHLQQAKDGSWGTHDKVLKTALATLALSWDTTPESHISAAGGLSWLRNSSDMPEVDMEAQAWRLFVVKLYAAEPEERHRPLLNKLSQQALRDWDTRTPFVQFCWQMLAPPGMETHVPPTLCWRYNAWPQQQSANRLEWQFVHLCLRQLDAAQWGNLDWRQESAKALVRSQKKDPKGGGYWGPAADETAYVETAYAVLTLFML